MSNAKGRPKGQNRYPMGISPFSSPLTGDVLEFDGGQVRVVVECRLGIVVYYPEIKGERIGKNRTCTTKSWAELCSRLHARLIDAKVKR